MLKRVCTDLSYFRMKDTELWLKDSAKALREQTRMTRLQRRIETYQTLRHENDELSELTRKQYTDGMPRILRPLQRWHYNPLTPLC